jgi:predicted Zn-dependent peptidase
VAAPELHDEVVREIDALRSGGVTQAEVSRAVTLIETDFVNTMQSAAGRADRLSMFATYFRDPGLINTQADLYAAVTVADVNAFIADHLGEDNRASLIYVPRDGRNSGPQAHVTEQVG